MNVRVFHVRKAMVDGKEQIVVGRKLIDGRDSKGHDLDLKGGGTIAVMQDGGRYAIGIAVCSNKDSFCRRTGARIAKGRAEKVLNQMWEEGAEIMCYAPRTSDGMEEILEAIAHNLVEEAVKI